MPDFNYEIFHNKECIAAFSNEEDAKAFLDVKREQLLEILLMEHRLPEKYSKDFRLNENEYYELKHHLRKEAQAQYTLLYK